MDKKKNENFFLKLIKIKKEIRDCVQNGRDLKDVEKNNSNIQFRTPKCLKRYTKVKEWDNEYIVCIGHSCYWAGNKPDLPVIPCFTSKKW